MSSIVGDFRTLNALERAGYIVCRGYPKTRVRHWTGSAVREIRVKEGPKLQNWYQPFEHNGKRYRIEYFDGSFYPYVVRLDGSPSPAFV